MTAFGGVPRGRSNYVKTVDMIFCGDQRSLGRVFNLAHYRKDLYWGDPARSGPVHHQ